MSCTPAAQEELAAPRQLRVEALEHAQAELAVRLDGHGARVRQRVLGVGLELDALLEVDKPEFHFVGRIPRRESGDDGMQER